MPFPDSYAYCRPCNRVLAGSHIFLIGQTGVCLPRPGHVGALIKLLLVRLTFLMTAVTNFSLQFCHSQERADLLALL